MTRSRCHALSTACLALAVQACASAGTQDPPPVPSERATLLARMDLADGICRVYGDFGSIPNSTTFLEVLASGAPAIHNSVVVTGDKLVGRINFLPVELAIDGDHVVGTFAAQPVRFAVERTEAQTNVRLSPAWHLLVAQHRIALQAPSTSFEATLAQDGLYTGAVRTRDHFGKVTIRLANCDLLALRQRPDLLVLLFGAFEGSLARGDFAGEARKDAEFARR